MGNTLTASPYNATCVIKPIVTCNVFNEYDMFNGNTGKKVVSMTLDEYNAYEKWKIIRALQEGMSLSGFNMVWESFWIENGAKLWEEVWIENTR